MTRPNRLKQLHLTKLALVDRPANPRAVVVVAKRQTDPVSFREVWALLRAATKRTP